MRFADFILKNLLRRKTRSLLTALGVAIAIMAVVALLGISSGLRRSASERFEGRGIDLVVLRAGVAQRLNSSLNESIGKRLAELPHVQGVAPSLSDMVSFDDTSLIGVPVHGWPIDSFAFGNVQIVSGRGLKSDDQGQALLGRVLAGNLGKKVGDNVEIESQTFKVVGMFETANVFDNGSVILPLADLQTMMDRPDQVTEFQIAVDPHAPDRKATIAELREKIEQLADSQGKRLGLSAYPTEEFVNKNTEIRLSGAMAWITSAIALLIGSVGMLNTMIMSVLERTQEIGILRAIGWRKGRIIRMVLMEAMVLSLAGALAGTLGAVGLTRLLSAFSPLQTLVRADTSVGILAIGFGMATLVALVGGAYPAYRGASLPPTESLRYE